MPRHGKPSPTWRRSTMACGAVAGAPGSIRGAPRRARVAAPTRSVWFAKAWLTLPWPSTVMLQWVGANTVLRMSFPTSTTGRSTRQASTRQPITGSLAFFIDRDHRRKGAQSWPSWCPGPDREGGRRCRGGVSTGQAGKRTSASFLYNGTRGMFEKVGFSYERSKGKNHA